MEFIDDQAAVNDHMSADENDENQVINFSDEGFINDQQSFWDQGLSNYRLMNVTRNIDEACADLNDWKEYECSDPENYVHDSCKDFVSEIHEFVEFEKRIEKFKESLKQKEPENKESFYFAVLFGTYFKLKGKEASFEDDLQAFFGTYFWKN